MEGTCTRKGIVIGIQLTFGSFRCKTMSSCVYNETAEKRDVFAVLVQETLHMN